jgi:RND family efflux transporter MFP subunit
LGAVVPAGSELFRLIRQGRLEWRGEVAAAELTQIRRGQKVKVDASGAPVTGTVRQVAPTVDAATRNALVYVDLPDTGGRLKAGMFARGEFATGSSTALTLPQSAVLLRDGFSYVFTVGADGRVAQGKVATGRRSGDRVEILQGLDEKARVVASGGGFLAEGDTVRVVEAAPVVKPTALK